MHINYQNIFNFLVKFYIIYFRIYQPILSLFILQIKLK